MDLLRQVLRFFAIAVAVPGFLLLVLGVFGLILAVTNVDQLLGFDPGGPLLVWWGYMLYAKGVRAPLVESGGGVAWLTPIGVVVVYILPGSILCVAAWLLRRAGRN